MMRALLLTIGNDLRRDDGVAHAIVPLLRLSCDLESRAVPQLTPELAGDIAGYDAVIFADADAGAAELSVAAVNESAPPNPFTHVSTPAQIVVLARALFGFAGLAFLCRIPAREFYPGAILSRHANQLAVRAARQLEILLAELRAGAYDGRLR